MVLLAQTLPSWLAVGSAPAPSTEGSQLAGFSHLVSEASTWRRWMCLGGLGVGVGRACWRDHICPLTLSCLGSLSVAETAAPCWRDCLTGFSAALWWWNLW